MLTQFYDVCVLGDEAAGLLAGGLLARRGRRVALVQLSTPAPLPAHLLDLGTPEQLAAMPQVRQIHQELGLPRPLPRPMPTPLGLHLVEAEHRLAVRGTHDIAAEMGRSFFAQRACVQAFAERLLALDAELSQAWPSQPLRRRRDGTLCMRMPWIRGRAHLLQPFSSHPMWAELPPRHPLRRMLGSVLALCGARHATAYAATRLLAQLWRSGRPPEPPTPSAAELRQVAERHGADLYLMAPNAAMEVTGARLSGLHTQRGLLRAETFLDGLHTPLSQQLQATAAPRGLRAAWQRLCGPPPPQRLAAIEQAARPTQALWETSLVVAAEAIPAAMGSCAILSPRASGEAPLRVSVGPAGLPGTCRLTLHCMTPSGQPPSRLAQGAMQRQLGRLLPFYERHVLRPPQVPLPVGWQRLPYGLHAAPVQPLGGLRPLRGPLHNLWHCGPAVLPELGREGAYLVAAYLADRLGPTPIAKRLKVA